MFYSICLPEITIYTFTLKLLKNDFFHRTGFFSVYRARVGEVSPPPKLPSKRQHSLPFFTIYAFNSRNLSYIKSKFMTFSEFEQVLNHCSHFTNFWRFFRGEEFCLFVLLTSRAGVPQFGLLLAIQRKRGYIKAKPFPSVFQRKLSFFGREPVKCGVFR